MENSKKNTGGKGDRINVGRHMGYMPLAVTTLLVMLACLILYSLIRYSSKNVEQSLYSSMQQSAIQRRNNMDFRLGSLRQGAESLISIVYPYMSSGEDREGQLREYGELNSVLMVYVNNDIVSSARLYVPPEKIYSTQGHTFRSMLSLKNSPNADDMEFLKNSGLFWLEPHEVDNAGDLNETIEAISCVYSIRERTDYDSIACVLFMDMDVALLDNIFSVDEEAGEKVYMVNGDGICLINPDRSLIGQPVFDGEVMDRIRELEAGNVKQLGIVYVFEKLKEVDWYIVVTRPEGSVYTSWGIGGQFFQMMLMGILVIFAILCLVFAYNLVMNVTLHRIDMSLTELITEGSDGAEYRAAFLNVAHRLEKNVDQMVRKVEDLMENRYRDQIAIAEYEMNALQEQIKPHFLYNTLDVIKWMILAGKADDGIWMVNALSRYLRQSINRGPAVIPLRDELELSRTYLMIMQKRFENRFTVKFEVEDGVEAYDIPKLSLQPLLENALLHGILYSEKPRKELIIRAWKEEEALVIEIEDNGNGMSEEKLRELEQDSGYGLSNVRRRILIFGKGRGEFRVFSREGIGTCITISVPIVHEGGE